MKSLLPVVAVLLLLTSCKAEFDPNAPWREVPVVYCVIDPDEDTVWVRLQRCFQGQENMYIYTTLPDSNYYLPSDVAVHLLAWDGASLLGANPTAYATLADRWELTCTETPRGLDSTAGVHLRPLYYCVPGEHLLADTGCLFQLVILRRSGNASSPSMDTLATAFTSLVGVLPKTPTSRGLIERVITNPTYTRAHEFGFSVGCRGFLEWNPLPRGRFYQPFVTFHYQKNRDTLSITIPGITALAPFSGDHFVVRPFTEREFLSVIRQHLASNTDTLYCVNNVDITLTVCNEDLYQYMRTQHQVSADGHELPVYSNINGGVGIFASRRTHITVNVPADSAGNPDNLPQRLVDLGVGFYGRF